MGVVRKNTTTPVQGLKVVLQTTEKGGNWFGLPGPCGVRLVHRGLYVSTYSVRLPRTELRGVGRSLAVPGMKRRGFRPRRGDIVRSVVTSLELVSGMASYTHPRCRRGVRSPPWEPSAERELTVMSSVNGRTISTGVGGAMKTLCVPWRRPAGKGESLKGNPRSLYLSPLLR